MENIPAVSNFKIGSMDIIDPEPQSRLGGFFKNFLNNTVSGISGILSPETMLGDFQGLIDKQIYWQIQMQAYSAESNIEKSKHEIAMSPIRNIRIN